MFVVVLYKTTRDKASTVEVGVAEGCGTEKQRPHATVSQCFNGTTTTHDEIQGRPRGQEAGPAFEVTVVDNPASERLSCTEQERSFGARTHVFGPAE